MVRFSTRDKRPHERRAFDASAARCVARARNAPYTLAAQYSILARRAGGSTCCASVRFDSPVALAGARPTAVAWKWEGAWRVRARVFQVRVEMTNLNVLGAGPASVWLAARDWLAQKRQVPVGGRWN